VNFATVPEHHYGEEGLKALAHFATLVAYVGVTIKPRRLEEILSTTLRMRSTTLNKGKRCINWIVGQGKQ